MLNHTYRQPDAQVVAAVSFYMLCVEVQDLATLERIPLAALLTEFGELLIVTVSRNPRNALQVVGIAREGHIELPTARTVRTTIPVSTDGILRTSLLSSLAIMNRYVAVRGTLNNPLCCDVYVLLQLTGVVKLSSFIVTLNGASLTMVASLSCCPG